MTRVTFYPEGHETETPEGHYWAERRGAFQWSLHWHDLRPAPGLVYSFGEILPLHVRAPARN